MPKYSYHRLIGLMIEQYGSRSAFAAAMGMNISTLFRKLSGKREWKTGEIATACELLKIPMAEMPSYFFDVKV